MTLGKSAVRIVILLIVTLAISVTATQFNDQLSLSSIQARLSEFQEITQSKFWQTIGMFAGLYFVLAATGLPGITVLNLLAGALFGIGIGTMTVIAAGTSGASIVFLLTRFGFGDLVQKKWGYKLQAINSEVEKNGLWYLFSVRMIPLFPIVLVNVAMGLTSMSLARFFIVTALGVLPGNLIYVSAGQAVGEIQSMNDIFSPKITLIFLLAAASPWLVKWIIATTSKK